MSSSENKPIQSRKPSQERSRQRVAQMMAAAEALLLENGPEQLSIPEVAKASGLSRSSVYQFFPSKYALLLALTARHLDTVAQQLARLLDLVGDVSVDDMLGSALRVVADYYNEHRAARILILGGPMSREGFQSLEFNHQDIGKHLRHWLERHQPDVHPLTEPDVMTLAVDIGAACLRHGYFREDLISDAIVEQARRAMLAYLRSVAAVR
ncbi:TetR/AcrR family transcriptional regulator [Marinobacter sp. JSM 1782161]|uniref:TetR/AcrR family transcriptional regulator n=1 Tax=Marinobacter sp. JSM 1782161 TaxID=2685906 RepID=UPI001401ED71|nr:TetR/AcrR family transcriptional regulator [Marinobacter sp. JSM 1782161]